MFVFLFVLDFLLNFETAGFDHLPKLPIPLALPLKAALCLEPRFKAPLFAPVETSFIFCSVTLLQCGQYLLTVFGIFIFFG